MKKIIALVLCALLALSMAACGTKPSNNTPQDNPQTLPATDGTGDQTGGDTQVPNPFADYGTLDEAVASAGFDFTVPEAYEGASDVKYRAIADNMTEVVYYDATGNELIRVRKSNTEGDISGDYNSYADVKDLPVGDRTVNFRGTNGSYNLATWSMDGYSYAVTAANGMTPEQWTALLDQIK